LATAFQARAGAEAVMPGILTQSGFTAYEGQGIKTEIRRSPRIHKEKIVLVYLIDIFIIVQK
jgi:hypothetical protein